MQTEIASSNVYTIRRFGYHRRKMSAWWSWETCNFLLKKMRQNRRGRYFIGLTSLCDERSAYLKESRPSIRRTARTPGRDQLDCLFAFREDRPALDPALASLVRVLSRWELAISSNTTNPDDKINNTHPCNGDWWRMCQEADYGTWNIYLPGGSQARYSGE